jgi:uncharacterized OB-fold protein
MGQLVTDLVTEVDGVDHLMGGRCPVCTTHTFPTQPACPRCGSATEAIALPATGRVWSWTVQRIAPKPPYRGRDPFEPFAVGYVDVGPVLVESRLAGKPVDEWQIGDQVRLATQDPGSDGDAPSYRFVPAEVPA